MGAERLDKALEPFAHLLLILLAILAIALVSSILIHYYVQRRRDVKHQKVSVGRRTKDTGVNLFAGTSEEEYQDPRRFRKRRKARKGSSNMEVDLFARARD